MYLVGIAGGSGSGKTTVAQKIILLTQSKSIVHIHQDSYYLAQHPPQYSIKGKSNFDHPLAFDWDLLRTQLKDLKSGVQVNCPVYDFVTSSRSPQILPIGPAHACIFDGIYALWDEQIRSMLDLKIFLDVDADIRFIRRLHRDVKERGRTLDSVISQYYDTVKPMHRQFVEPTKQFANLILGEETDISAEVVSNKIKAVLKIGS